MSTRHPIIAITGSSGAGTTTVTRSFEHIFRREKVTAPVIEGDTFHRYDRNEMSERAGRGRAARATSTSATSGPRTTCFAELEQLFRELRRNAAPASAPQVPARRRRGRAVQAGARHLHALGRRAEPAPTCCSTKACTAPSSTPEVNVATSSRPADRRGADHQPGVDPEAATATRTLRGYSTEAVTDTILRRMPDYVNHICPQFSAHARQLPARADGGHQQPVHRARHPERRREHGA